MKRAALIGLALWLLAAVLGELLAPDSLLLYTAKDWRTAARTPGWQIGSWLGAVLFCASMVIGAISCLVGRLRRLGQN